MEMNVLLKRIQSEFIRDTMASGRDGSPVLFLGADAGSCHPEGPLRGPPAQSIRQTWELLLLTYFIEKSIEKQSWIAFLRSPWAWHNRSKSGFTQRKKRCRLQQQRPFPAGISVAGVSGSPASRGVKKTKWKGKLIVFSCQSSLLEAQDLFQM
ncbi:Phd Finger Protein 20-Like Protein 1 [Manis pentadactyla]|nr:Phd Finger Protein 20-Like Protein 1 [Manis pentadactyla]